LLMLAWKIAPALAAGNTVVLKPAETTPLSAMLFAGICMQAELPPGVVNIVTGAGKPGSLVVTHPDVKKVALTGSTEVGKMIQRAIAGSGKRLTLELGGKAANIVFEDAPLDQAVEGIVNGIYFNQGHVCCAGSRLLVQESIAEPLLDKLKRRLSTLRLGDPLDKNTDIGAINSGLSWRRSRASSSRESKKAPSSISPSACCPSAGSGFRRRCSPTCRSRTASPAKRSLGRCSRYSPSARRMRQSRRRTTRRTAFPPACGRTRARESCGWPSACGRASSGRTPSTASIRPRRSAATRSPASAARAACTAFCRTWSSTDGRAQDVQAVRERRVRALGVRARVPARRHRQRAARLAQGHPRRGAGRSPRAHGRGRAHGDEPRPDPVPGRRDAGRPRGPVRRAPWRRPAGATRARPGGGDAGLVRRLDRQAVAGDRDGEPGRRALLQLHDPRTDGRRRDHRP